MKTCTICRAAVHEGTYLCENCCWTLEVALGNISAYWQDLDTVRSRQTRFTLSPSASNDPTPLPIDARFGPAGRGTEVMHAVRNDLVGWVRITVEDWSLTWPADTIPAMCGHLSGILAALAGQEYAADLYRSCIGHERDLRNLVDRPPTRIFAGYCTVCAVVGQQVAMYAGEGDTKVTCPAEDCGRHYDLAECRAYMLADLEDRLMTAAEAARIATYLDLLSDRERTRKNISAWGKSGLIEAKTINLDGDPMFRFGDIRERLESDDFTRRRDIQQRRISKGA